MSQSWNLYKFEDHLYMISACSICHSQREVCVLGVFNVKATDVKGELLVDGAVGVDIKFINRRAERLIRLCDGRGNLCSICHGYWLLVCLRIDVFSGRPAIIINC